MAFAPSDAVRVFARRHVTFPLVERVVRAQAGHITDWLEARSRDEPSVVRARQDERLRRIVRWAHQTVPFYRTALSRADVRPEDVDGIADLGRLPILHRRDLQVGGDARWSTGVPHRRQDRRTTSGSTGMPIVAVRDRALAPWGQASWWQGLRWCGVHPADPMLDIAVPGRVGMSRWNRTWYWLTGSRALPIRAVMLRDAAAVRKICESFRPALVVGMPDQLLLLAEMVRDGMVSLGAAPRAVLYRGATMPAHARETILRALQAPVFSRYAAFEFIPAIAHACEHGWLHVNAECYAVEIVSGVAGSPHGAPAASGRVLITDLRNQVAPLLRYEIGDLAQSAPDGPCPCGRTWPRIGDIQGRAMEFAVTADGRRITPVALERALFGALPDIADRVWEYQFVQERLGEMEIRVVPKDSGLRGVERDVADRVAAHFHDLLRVRLTFAEHIPRAPSGKRPMVIGAAIPLDETGS